MKARKKNSNDEWKDVVYVQLKDSDILYKQEYLEFDTLSTELKINEQIADENHWQAVRERAAIAAMQGTMTILGSNDRGAFREIVVEGYRGKERTYPKEIAEFAVACADALIELLKRNNYE